MGATAGDLEICLNAIVDEIELKDQCADSSVGKLAEIVAEVLSEGDVRAMRHCAARLSAFLKVVVGVTVPPGVGSDVSGSSSAFASVKYHSETWGEFVRAVGTTAVVATPPDLIDPHSSSEAGGQIGAAWREKLAAPLVLFLRQFRHLALVKESIDLDSEESETALTVDDKVLEALRPIGPHRSGDIAARLTIDRAQVSRSLTRLVRSGKAREASSRTEDGRGRWYEIADVHNPR